MNIEESIRRILREETESGKYTKAIQGILEYFKNEDCVCDIDMWYDDEDDMYLVYLVFGTEELNDKFTSDGKFGYVRKKQKEVEETIKSFLPIKNIRVGSYGTPHCGWKSLNESEDNKEKKIQKNLRAIKELINMVDYSEVCDIWVEYDPEDGYYAIRSKMSTKNHNTKALEKEFEFLEESIKSLGLKAYISHPYWVEECEDKNELNESEDNKEKKIQKNLRAIRQLLDTIDIEGLCEIGVEYNPEDGDYEIRSKTTIRYYDMADMTQELGYIEDTIISWGLRTYVFTPRYVENCEDERGIEFLNESKQERKFTKLLNNIEEYLNSNSYNSVVRFMIDYDEVMDDVIVNIFIDAEHAAKLGGGINSVIKRSGKKIMEDLSVFPFDFKYHIHFERPQLNESETKTNSSLHRLLNMLFDGFDDIYYDWANYMCGMGECCDPYAIGFTLPESDYDDYIFKLVDGEMYDDDGDYPKEFRDELPEVCYEQPNLKNPDFNTIVFYGAFAEEIEDYMGHPHNWNLDLLKIINNQFGCNAKTIIII